MQFITGALLVCSFFVIVSRAYTQCESEVPLDSPAFSSGGHDTTAAERADKDWLLDDVFSTLSETIPCDIRVLVKGAEEFDTTMLDAPLLLRGFMNLWPALNTWDRPSLLKQYANRSLKSGIPSQIVNTNGQQSFNQTFETFLSSLRYPKNNRRLFSFDSHILKSIPELENDYEVPSMFGWDNKTTRETFGTSITVLSMGASRDGLPFHEHGDTWLGKYFVTHHDELLVNSVVKSVVPDLLKLI